MENPSRLEENLELLAREMAALKYCRKEVATKEAKRMEGWVQSIESKENDLDEIKRELNGLKDNFHARVRLNRKVIESLKAVTVLKEGVNSISKSIETLLSDLIGDKPKRFTYGNLKSFTSNFKTTVDTDHNGNVFKGQFTNGLQIVVKVLTEKDAGEEIFTAEVNTMFKTSHCNLVKLYGFCFEGNTKALVYEFMQNGSLDKILYKNHHSDMEWEQLHGIAIQAAKGLSYLHDGCDERIIHHDVKASNVLLDSNFSSKITNFGVAKRMSRDKTHLTLTRTRGTPGYAAPEMWIQSSRITYKSDVYSFGMLLFEILARKSNNETKEWQPKTIWERYDKGQLDELIEECRVGDKNKEKAKVLCMVAFWCAQFTQQNRPSMSVVVKMLEMEIPVTAPPNPFVPSVATSPDSPNS